MEIRKLAEGAEPEVFQLAFKDWDAIPVKPIVVESPVSAPTKMDIDTLYVVPMNLHPDTDEINVKMQIVNNYLITFSTFVFQKGKFMPLPEKERGHFFCNDAYIFLCVYRAPEEDLERLINHSLDDSETPDIQDEFMDDDDCAMHCVVYFCQSARASKVAHSTFKLSTQKELEGLVAEKYGCPISVEIVEYGREPFALLAHLENDYVMHYGSRNKPSKEPKTFYQIRTDFRYGTTRGYEVKLEDLVITSIDSLYIQTAPECYLYKGDNVKASAFDSALELAQSIYLFHNPKKDDSTTVVDPFACDDSQVDKYNFRTVSADNLLEDFVLKIGKELFKPIQIPNVRPRVFEFSTRPGYLSVERLTHYTQKNLFPESCVIIDLGHPDPIFLWVGASASEQVIKFTRYCLDIWLNTCQDGRTLTTGIKRKNSFKSFQIEELDADTSEILVIVKQGKEPRRFKAFFQGWDDYLLDIKDPGSLFSRAVVKPTKPTPNAAPVSQ